MNIFNFKRFRKKDSYSIISHNTIAELERFKENIKNCNYQILDEEATTKSKLFEYYNQYLDTIYMPLRNVLNCSVFTVDNEIRAMFGHVLDSISDDEGDYNIQKAHGHLRRAIIDVFKITCNNIDLFYNDWLKRYYKYDFRNTHSEFLREFSQRYYTAKNQYQTAQDSECVGSDKIHKNNILGNYANAAYSYIEMLLYYAQNEKSIKKMKREADIRGSLIVLINVISFALAIHPLI